MENDTLASMRTRSAAPATTRSTATRRQLARSADPAATASPGRNGQRLHRRRRGNDYLEGGAGTDYVVGGADNDMIAGVGGSDHLDGGQRRDRVSYRRHVGRDRANRHRHQRPGRRVGHDRQRRRGARGLDPRRPAVRERRGRTRLIGLGRPTCWSATAASTRSRAGGARHLNTGGDGKQDQSACGTGADVANADLSDTVAADCETTHRAEVQPSGLRDGAGPGASRGLAVGAGRSGAQVGEHGEHAAVVLSAGGRSSFAKMLVTWRSTLAR